jgi:hypothetical protein
MTIAPAAGADRLQASLPRAEPPTSQRYRDAGPIFVLRKFIASGALSAMNPRATRG